MKKHLLILMHYPEYLSHHKDDTGLDIYDQFLVFDLALQTSFFPFLVSVSATDNGNYCMLKYNYSLIFIEYADGKINVLGNIHDSLNILNKTEKLIQD